MKKVARISLSQQPKYDDYIHKDQIGTPLGVASLDEDGKVPSNQLPEFTGGGTGGSINVIEYHPSDYAKTEDKPIVLTNNSGGAEFSNDVFSILYEDRVAVGLNNTYRHIPYSSIEFGLNSVPEEIILSKTQGNNSFGIAFLSRYTTIINYLTHIFYHRYDGFKSNPSYAHLDYGHNGVFIGESNAGKKITVDGFSNNYYHSHIEDDTADTTLSVVKQLKFDFFLENFNVTTEAELLTIIIQEHGATEEQAQAVLEHLRTVFVYKVITNGETKAVLENIENGGKLSIYQLPQLNEDFTDFVDYSFDTSTQLEISPLVEKVSVNYLPSNVDGAYLKLMSDAVIDDQDVYQGNYILPYNTGNDFIVVGR